MRQVALRGLRARPLRTVLTAFSIVLGVAMIAGTYVLTDTIDKSFSETFQQANSGTDVVVSPKKVDAAFDESPPPLSDDLVDRVRKVDGVAAAAGAIRDDVSIRDAQGDRIGGNLNFVMALQPKPLDPFVFVSGRAPRAPDELALSAKAFADGDFALGDKVTVVGSEGLRRFRLVGSARFGEAQTVSGFPAAIVTLPSARRSSAGAAR